MIRKVTEKDYAALSELHKACFSKGWSEDDIKELLAASGSFALMTDVSFIIYRIMADEAEIISIATIPDCRRNNNAGELLLAAIDGCVNNGTKTIYLEVAENNTSARTFYLKHGFTETGKRTGYYLENNKLIDAVLMKRVVQ